MDKIYIKWERPSEQALARTFLGLLLRLSFTLGRRNTENDVRVDNQISDVVKPCFESELAFTSISNEDTNVSGGIILGRAIFFQYFTDKLFLPKSGCEFEITNFTQKYFPPFLMELYILYHKKGLKSKKAQLKSFWNKRKRTSNYIKWCSFST